MKKVLAAARSPLGRAVISLLGLGSVALLVWLKGPALVWHAMSRSPAVVTLGIALEGGVALLELAGLWGVYRSSRKAIPRREFLRAGLVGYALMWVPAGRAVVEATRAALLAHRVGAAKAAAAATRMQALLLTGNAVVCVPAAVAAFALLGRNIVSYAVAANGVLMILMSGGILLAARLSHIGAWMGRHLKSAHDAGPAFDEALRAEPAFAPAAFLWVCGARAVQLLQRSLLLVAVGGPFDLVKGAAAHGIHMVSASIGDLIPGQLGATEAGFNFAAAALSLTPSDAIAIALLAHLGQLFWVGVASLAPLVWPAPKVLPSPAP